MAKRGPKGPSKWTDAKIEKLAEKLTDWVQEDPETHFILEEWCFQNGIGEQRVSEFAKKSKKFSEALALVKINQKKQLILGGLTSAFNPVITKLMLMNNHDMAEKKSTEHTGKDGEPIQHNHTIEFVKSNGKGNVSG